MREQILYKLAEIGEIINSIDNEMYELILETEGLLKVIQRPTFYEVLRDMQKIRELLDDSFWNIKSVEDDYEIDQ